MLTSEELTALIERMDAAKGFGAHNEALRLLTSALVNDAPQIAKDKARIVELEDKVEALGSPTLLDFEIEDALKAEKIYVWGPAGEQFERMFKVVMDLRRKSWETPE